MTTTFLRFPSEATFLATLPQEAFRCTRCNATGKVLTKAEEGYYEPAPDPDDPDYTVRRWVETAPAEYGPCPKCGGTGRQDRIDGETCSPLPEGVKAISIVGEISEGGQWDEAGNVLVAPTVLPGWHVNMLGAAPEAWVPYVVTPGTPVRIFGGEA